MGVHWPQVTQLDVEARFRFSSGVSCPKEEGSREVPRLAPRQCRLMTTTKRKGALQGRGEL